MIELQHILHDLQAFIPSIGTYQLSFFRDSEYRLGYLKNDREIVSEVDIESERKIISYLRTILPQAACYGEETDQLWGDEWTWVIDPIDGTVNYVSGLTDWAISIGLLYRKKPVLGLIYQPAVNDTFTAITGEGAWFNGKALPVLPFSGPLQEALLATGLPFRSPDVAHGFYLCAEKLLPHCREIRRRGSAALDLAYLGSGFFQGYWETDLKLYDIAAAYVILQETGMVISDFFGNRYDLLSSRSLIVAHPLIYKELMSYIAGGYADYRDLLQQK